MIRKLAYGDNRSKVLIEKINEMIEQLNDFSTHYHEIDLNSSNETSEPRIKE